MEAANMTDVEFGDRVAHRDARVAERAEEARQHIVSAMKRQTGLNSLNFFVGFTGAVLGLFILYGFLPATRADLSGEGAISYFLARLSLVTLVEAFAFFFLRLYRFVLVEVKYFRDELTGVNMRVLALRF